MSGSATVADYMRRSVAAADVLHRHGIVLGGHRLEPIADACARSGLAVATLEAEVAAAEAAGEPLATAHVEALIDHVLERYHVPLRRELPRLRSLAARVSARHAGRRPELAEIGRIVADFVDSTEEHLAKEEQTLFPWIRAGYDGVERPISFLKLEHVENDRDLRRLREASDGFTVPPEADEEWRELYGALTVLERESLEHMRLENEGIFRRALAGGH